MVAAAVLAAAAVVIVVLVGQGGTPTPVASAARSAVPSAPPGAVQDTIEFVVSSNGPATVSVVYATDTASHQAESNVPTPWVKTLRVPHQTSPAYSVVAGLNGGSIGSKLSCSVTVNGVMVSDHSTYGANATVVCAGVPN